MSQKLISVVKINSSETNLTFKNHQIPGVFPGINKFTRYIAHHTENPNQSLNMISVNVDVAEGIPAYTKIVTLSLCNVSESVITPAKKARKVIESVI